jgi:hypothetical protein
MNSEVEWSRVKYIAEASPYRIEGRGLILLQLNCMSVYRSADKKNLERQKILIFIYPLYNHI